MHSKKLWDMIVFFMVISFIFFIIYAKIYTFNDKKQVEDVDSEKATRQAAVDIEDVGDKPIHMMISEPFLSEEEINETADLVIIGQITDIKKESISEVKDASGNTTNLAIPYITYDVSIIESLKNPTKERNIKVRSIYAITYGYNPSEIKQGDIYKFYLSSNKNGSYSLVTYRIGIQKFTED